MIFFSSFNYVGEIVMIDQEKTPNEILEEEMHTTLGDGLYPKNFEDFSDSESMSEDDKEALEIIELQKRFRIF